MLVGMTPKLVSILAAMVLALGLSACGDDDSADAPDSPGIEGLTRSDPLLVGEVEATAVDTTGTEKPFRFVAEPGGLLYVYFGYTHCPDLCPATFADFKRALASLDPAEAEQIDVAFVTVDPDRDTPEIMNGYLGHFVEGGTAVRVADREQLEAVEAAFGASSTVQTNADGVVEVSHTSISYVVDPDGRVVVEWPFGVKSDAMANDLHILLSQLS